MMRSALVRGGLGVGDRKKTEGDDGVQKTLLLRKQQHLRIANKQQSNNNSPLLQHRPHNNKRPAAHQQQQLPPPYKRPDGLELPYGTIPYFLGAALVVIVSAIFMHLIATSHQQYQQFEQSRRRQILRKKPKTDEYNEDARDDHHDLLSESVRQSNPTNNSKLYAPPHHEIMHRHRMRLQPPTLSRASSNSFYPSGATTSAIPNAYSPPTSRYRPPSPKTPDLPSKAIPLSTTASSFASLVEPTASADEERPQTPNTSFRRNPEQGTPRIANTDDRLVPFVPPRLAEERPPRSVNLEELRVFERNDDLKHAVLATADEIYEGIPSGDPRNAIQHRRPDITNDTNSSRSLQLAIDFSEIKLVEVIGGGGFGQVWRGVWKGTPVAVKVLTGNAQSRSVPRGILEEFAAEINLLRGMRHPNICLLIGACLEPPNRAIITELALFGSLWDALRLPLQSPHTPCDGISRDGWPEELYRPDAKHGMPPSNAIGRNPVLPHKGAWKWNLVHRVALGAARGMAYLHGGKPPILHRDLKSANILLDESYTAKVCDFGLSRIKSQGQSMTGNCGTVQWMAPEVLANQAYNEKADIYSYGIIFWELFSQQCPYDKMTPIQCALAVLNRNQRPEIPKWCPPPLQALIRSCLKKDPQDRPTFEQIIETLDRMPQ